MSRFEPAVCPKCGGPMPYLSSCQSCGYLPGRDSSNKLGAAAGCLFVLFIGAVLFGNFVYPRMFPDPTAEERLAVIRQLRQDGKFRVDEGTGATMIRRADWESAMGGDDGVESGLTLMHTGWIYDCSSDDEQAITVELIVDIEEGTTGDSEWLHVRAVVVKVMTKDPDDPGNRKFDYKQHSI
ncbi:MAG: hypothetical protein H8E44_41730 [Planctomycetes bacterium]|nr:hypothetical protein [Planctomycetota bacterium]